MSKLRTVSPPPPLPEALQARLARGEHESVAESLLAQDRPGDAGWVYEQIWDFSRAFRAYATAQRPIDALRMALASERTDELDEIVSALETGSSDTIEEAIVLLDERGRAMAVARLRAARGDRPELRANAMLRAGDATGAARVLADAGQPDDALRILTAPGRTPSRTAAALAAELSWDLGDAEAAARHAQRYLRGTEDPDSARPVAALLARALGSLGHDLAAQMVLDRSGAQPRDDALPGRYRVTGLFSGGLVGSAYVGFDRITLQEVEIHLLLADQAGETIVDPAVVEAIRQFAAVARAASELGHPAIRPVALIDEDAGLLVLPRAEGPPLRSMIRPPGLLGHASRARGLVAFLCEGLAAAHARGLVHGRLLPGSIVTDAVGRPLLPAFGARHLAGLAATHTGSLDEVLAITAPELRGGEAPTVAGDVFALGRILAALLLGSLSALPDPDDPTPEVALALRMSAPDPEARGTATEALELLRAPVADVRDLGGALDAPGAARSVTDGSVPQLAEGIEITAADSWEDDQLAALCAEENPWWQPVLDRADRTVVVAPWPDGSRTLEPGTPRWRRLVPAAALEIESASLRAAIESRLTSSSLVATPSRPWMIALDDLLRK